MIPVLGSHLKKILSPVIVFIVIHALCNALFSLDDFPILDTLCIVGIFPPLIMIRYSHLVGI